MDLRELYKDGLRFFDLGELPTKMLTRIISDDEDAKDFEEAICTDKFFTDKMIIKASAAIKLGTISSLSHAVSLLGKEVSRNFVLGHSLQRLFHENADKELKDIEKSTANIKRARHAEEIAKNGGCSYVGAAYATGYLFDLLETWMKSNEEVHEKFAGFFEKNWTHALRTAALSWAFSSNPKIKLVKTKLVFGAGLLHDIGKLLLALSYPSRYEPLLSQFEKSQEASPLDDSYEIELEMAEFKFSHPEAGSLLLWQTGLMREWEAAAEYHHEFPFLEVRDPDLNILVTVVHIADRLAFLLESVNTISIEQIEEIIEPHKKFFKLDPKEVSDTIITLRAKSVLV